jgi:formamidopyrimidine-DNA glycosylase
MPELPDVESARLVIAHYALHRPIVRVDSVDPYVCRPFSARDFQQALIGRQLDQANRVGKQLLLPTAGHVLGLHLGMGGRVVITDGDGQVGIEADSTHGLAGPHRHEWDRFVVTFADKTALRLVDKRRLGRATLDPDISHLGQDALQIATRAFDEAILRGRGPIKARLMDQSVLSGVGNLIADETLWRAKVAPTRASNTLSAPELSALYRSMRHALRHAVSEGGSHTGRLIPHRHEGGLCPRCGSPLAYTRVGGRSTWWCTNEQQ